MATVSDNKYAYYNQADSVFYPHQSKHGVVDEDANYRGKKMSTTIKFDQCRVCKEYKSVKSGDIIHDTTGTGITPQNTKVESISQFHR